MEEEAAQAERQHQGDLQGEDSEAEERRFKANVAAVVRKNPKQRKFAIVPYPRFRPDVGGGGAAARLDMRRIDMRVHESALGERGRVHINLVV